MFGQSFDKSLVYLYEISLIYKSLAIHAADQPTP
jgi:hypothetical protein